MDDLAGTVEAGMGLGFAAVSFIYVETLSLVRGLRKRTKEGGLEGAH